jgi:type IV pilus assembly protein PilQ
VHGTEEVSLDVEAEFKVLTGESLNGIPVIATRQLQSQVRLRNGEWAVVAGLMSASEARTITGPAGLSRLPVLGHLFRDKTRTRDVRDLLLILKPTLLSLPPDREDTRPVWVGTQPRPLTPL